VVTRQLRVVFFGTPEFAVPTLERLLSAHHQIVAVVTQPDRPRGRGQRPSAPPVKRMAEQNGVPVWQPDRMRDPAFLASLSALTPDCGIVAAYGRILPEVLLAIPRRGLLNVHASLLPRYRGAAPIERAIMAGETETGVTIMRVVKELDAGPMLARVARPIGPEETGAEVEMDLARLGAALLLDVVDRLEVGMPEEVQDDRLATYAPRISREDGSIDWARPAQAIHNQVRALHPWPHAFTHLRDHRLIVLRTVMGATVGAETGRPGEILAAAGDTLRVATGTTALDLVSIQLEGRRPMSPREFLAGHRLEAGMVFRS
jgi:methionyl-tRNA formyltransferase